MTFISNSADHYVHNFCGTEVLLIPVKPSNQISVYKRMPVVTDLRNINLSTGMGFEKVAPAQPTQSLQSSSYLKVNGNGITGYCFSKPHALFKLQDGLIF